MKKFLRFFGRFYFSITALLILATCSVQGQTERDFSVPLNDLKIWSENVVVPFKAKITGHSAVHAAASDCEMHMGAALNSYGGDPPGWVLEPMNLCEELMPKMGITSKAKWEILGDTLTNKNVTGSGVPRLWPEHLEADPAHADSNPSHATEIHPLVDLSLGADKYDFSSFIYAPEELAGIKPKTAAGILAHTSVKVREHGGIVDIIFESGTIGNFAILQITIDRDSIKDVGGSHVMEGVAIADNEQPTDVRLVTVRGSEVNDTVAKAQNGKGKHVTMEALILFSLNPQALFAAAQQSHGKEIDVETPIQLIVYGPPGQSE
jgi:hypothetical protein